MSAAIDGCNRGTTYAGSPFVDQLTDAGGCPGGSNILDYRYGFDQDGRATAKTWPNDSSGAASWFETVTYGVSPQSSSDTVFKGLSVAGSLYNYFIDAFGRRRLKAYPTNNVSDEYFHSIDSRLLTDQGNDSISSPSFYPEDDYVWLGGRPVVIVRGEFDTTWTRQSDWTSSCSRNGDGSACGVYFPVTDHIGKPVLMLDSTRRIAGEADYDPLGQPNRVALDGESAHPYTRGTNYTLATVAQPIVAPSLTVQLRAIFPLVDLWYGGVCFGPSGIQQCGGDDVEVDDAQGGGVLWSYAGGALCPDGQQYGPHAGKIVSSWVHPTQGASTPAGVAIKLKTPSLNVSCPLGVCSCVAQTGSSGYTGAIVDAYEFQRFQTGSTPFWTPLRFPGQYYDAESDLAENWNRYYDPQIGRYLTPEPLLSRGPQYAEVQARHGRDAPAYAYAGNNPMTGADPTGLYNLQGDCPNWEEAVRIAKEKAGCKDKNGKACKPNCKLPCDICQFLDDPDFPPAYVKDLTVEAKAYIDPRFQTPGALPAMYLKIDRSRCSGSYNDVWQWLFGDNNTTELAKSLVHESMHLCKGLGATGPGTRDPESEKAMNDCFK